MNVTRYCKTCVTQCREMFVHLFNTFKVIRSRSNSVTTAHYFLIIYRRDILLPKYTFIIFIDLALWRRPTYSQLFIYFVSCNSGIFFSFVKLKVLITLETMYFNLNKNLKYNIDNFIGVLSRL